MQRFVAKFFAVFALFTVCAAAQAGEGSARPTAVPDFTLSRPNPAQVQVQALNEGFGNVANLTAAGWVMVNHSAPVGSTGWFQGIGVPSGGPFNGADGGPTSYIAANYQNTGNTGTISNWLLTPVLDFGSAQSFTFYTRKANPDTYADRLEVRFSTAGASSNVGVSATDVGDFTNLALSINPNLVLGVYPTSWTQFTVTGLPHNGQGRVAFRYFVTGAGLNGTNSDYIGIDRVVFSAGAPEYEVSATVAGLVGSGLSLSLNGGAPLAVAADGTVTLGNVLNGASYAVTVATPPTAPSQTCIVTNGSGTIAGANVTATVTCTTDNFTVGGSVSGLAGSGLTLQINGGDTISLVGDGNFTFPNPLADLSPYAVTVATQPSQPSQTCSVSNGSGALAGANVTNVTVSCTTNEFTVGGSVSGLAGSGLTLQVNGGDTIGLIGDGNFTFPNPLPDLSPYVVTVATQPSQPNQTCSVSNGNGTLAGANVTNVTVICTNDEFTVGGSVSGLAGSGLTLKVNGGDTIGLVGDGNFTFPNPLPDLSPYVVTVATQPSQPNQTCSVSNGSGTLAGANVTNVIVICTTNQYAIGGEIFGLDGASGLLLNLNGGNTIGIIGDGSFVFPETLADGSFYEVTVAAQPSGANNLCVVFHGAGRVVGSDVATVEIFCDVIFIGGFEIQPQ